MKHISFALGAACLQILIRFIILAIQAIKKSEVAENNIKVIICANCVGEKGLPWLHPCQMLSILISLPSTVHPTNNTPYRKRLPIKQKTEHVRKYMNISWVMLLKWYYEKGRKC